MTSCGLVYRHQHFRERCCLQIQDIQLEWITLRTEAINFSEQLASTRGHIPEDWRLLLDSQYTGCFFTWNHTAMHCLKFSGCSLDRKNRGTELASNFVRLLSHGLFWGQMNFLYARRRQEIWTICSIGSPRFIWSGSNGWIRSEACKKTKANMWSVHITKWRISQTFQVNVTFCSYCQQNPDS